MMMKYFVDYGFNSPLSFTQKDTPYSRAFPGSKEDYEKHMENTKALFDSADVYKAIYNNPTDSTEALDYIMQHKRWEDLNTSLSNTKNNAKMPTKLIGFDFETLMADVAHPYKVSEYTAVTELGIAETIMYRSGISKKSREYSIAGGINETQLKKYLELYKQFDEQGLNSFEDKTQRQMVESLMERFSRYGQSNIEDMLETTNVRGIGNVVVFKGIGDSKTFNPNYIRRGISHLAVLGGIEEDVFEKAVNTVGLTSKAGAYAKMQKSFSNAGLSIQTLDKNSTIAKKISKYFNTNLTDNVKHNTFIMGFNSNAFDLNIYQNFIGNNLTKKNTIDVYTGIKRIGLGNTQERLAKMFGIPFLGTAHNAGPDARVTTLISMLDNAIGNKSLPQLISESKPKGIQGLGTDKQIFYALNSIALNKNGDDYYSENMYNISGVQRGRYYTIGETKLYKDGRFAIEFKTVAEDTNETFIKVYDTVEEGIESVRENFTVQNKNNLTKNLAKRAEHITNADKARRNYENLFSTENITYNASDKKFQGGYETLNQYYKAYNIASEKIGNLDESVIQDIAESSKYDEQIIYSLREAFDIQENIEIPKSRFRDFKAIFGRIHDEAPMLEYITDKLNNTGLNSYQKTIAANEMVKYFTNTIEDNNVIKAVAKNIAEFSYLPSERDMFAVDIKMAEDIVNINFANKDDAVKTLTKNFYYNTGKKANPMDVANNMLESVKDLYTRGLVNFDFLMDFYKTAGIQNNNVLKFIKKRLEEKGSTQEEIENTINKFNVLNPSEIQPRKLAEMIANKMDNDYVRIAKDKSFTYDEFSKKDFSRFKDNEKLLKFFSEKTEKISGSEVIAKARSNKYQNSDGVINTIGKEFQDILNNNIDEITSEVDNIVSNATSIRTLFDENTFKEILQNSLGYSKVSAEQTSRMIFSTYKDKSPFGIATYKTKDYKGREKTKFITQFAYSGNNNEDAFILINENNGRSVSKVMDIMGDNSMSFIDKINLIKDEGYASVLSLKAIDKFNINIDTNDPSLHMQDVEGNASGISFNTIQNGDKGYVKISQMKLDVWDQGIKTGEDTLENLRFNLTDDATITSTNFRKMRKNIMRILEDDTLPVSERNKIVSKMFSRANNSVLSAMPGPVGYQTLYIPNQGFTKTLVPSVADFLQSSYLEIQPFEILALEVAKKDVLNYRNNTGRKEGMLEVAKTLINLAGESEKDYEKSLEKMIAKAKSGQSLSAEFDEYFYKHFANVPMGLEENFSLGNAEESKFTIIDYLKNRKAKGYKFHEDTNKVIDWLSNNNFSQFAKESAAQDKKVLTVQNLLLNQYSFMDPSIRPTSNQIQGAKQALISQLEEDFDKSLIDKLKIKIGYDATTLQRAEFDKAISGYKVFGDITTGDLTDAITTNVKQMDSAEIISKFIDYDKNFSSVFADTIQNITDSYGLSKTDSEYLLQVAFNIMKNRSANVYESRGIARPAFANNTLFTSPERKTISINEVDEEELKYLKNNKTYQEIFDTNYIKRGTKFKLSDGNEITYSGPSGVIENIDEFLTTGKTGLFEATIDANGEVRLLPNVGSAKYFVGYEKGMLYTPEFDTNIGREFVNKFENIDTAENAYIDFLDKIFVKVFGDDVAAVGDFTINKHRTKGLTYGGYMNTMFYHVNKYIDETGDTGIYTELSNIFTEADPYGLKLGRYNGQSVFDPSKLGKHGVFTQIETAIEKIQQKGKDNNSKYKKIWNSIAEEIKYNDANNIFRTAINIGTNNEAMGGAMYFDPRMELMLRMQGKGDLENYIKVEDNTKVNPFDYIADVIQAESIDNIKDTSATPIETNFGKKRASALKTVQGLELSAENMYSPESIANSNKVLDIDLKDVIIDPSGSDPRKLTEHSIFKIMDSKGSHYSDFLKEQASKSNKNIEDIIALRINFGDDVSFDIKTGKDTVKNGVNQLLVPLYDLTPFKDTVQYEQRLRDLNYALQIAKDYGRTKGIEESRKDLNKAVETLYTRIVSDLNPQDKNSYIVQRTLRTPMKNSRMLHADSSIVPALNVMTDDYTKWLAKGNENYRQEILTAIKTGDISKYDIDVSTTKLTGRKYTTTIDGKLYYDDIVEMSKEGLENIGINFRTTGLDIVRNKANYKTFISELNDSDFFEKDYALKIANEIKENGHYSTEVIEAIKNKEKYDELFSMFGFDTPGAKAKRKAYKEQLRNKLDTGYISNEDLKIYSNNLFEEIEKDFKLLNQELEKVTEDYLTKVGTFGFGLRYPTFYEDSEGPIILRLNKTLARDEMIVSGVFGSKINMDHDADKGVIKAFIDRFGKIVNRQSIIGNKEYTFMALNEGYKSRVYNEKNNEEMGGLVKKQIEKIDSSPIRIRDGIEVGSAVDYISDLANKNLTLKQVSIAGDMTIKSRNELLTELGLEQLINIEPKEYTQEQTEKVFKAWSNKFGNMLENMENIAASSKSRIAKVQVGSVSNINYMLNQVLYESLDHAIQQGDNASINKYKGILEVLHSGSKGLLPATEQKGIDVKHAFDGFLITEARKYNQGVKKLFQGKYDEGISLIEQAVKDKIVDSSKPEDIEKWNSYMQAITNLAKDKRANTIFTNLNVAKNIDEMDKALDFMEHASEYEKYVNTHGLTSSTAVREVLNAIKEINNQFTMGYYHNSIMQDISKDSIMISLEDGTPVFYRTQGTPKKNKKGLYSMRFDFLDSNNEWRKSEEIITGTPIEIQTKLQQKFGNFMSYNKREVTRDITGFRKQINQEASIINANKFANMYSKGNTEMANRFLTTLENNKSKSAKESVKRIKQYLDFVENTNEGFIEFTNKLNYIKSDTNIQTKESFEIDNVLDDINKRIIEMGKNKSTSTTEIFNEELSRLASDITKLSSDSLEFQNYTKKRQEALINAFNNYEDLEKGIIDIRRARNELSAHTDSENIIDAILKKYKEQNREYFSSLIKPNSTSEMDTMFNWNSNNLGDMRVGIQTKSGLYGRKFSSLTQSDVDEIINFTNKGDGLSKYAYDTTKAKLLEYKSNNQLQDISPLQGAKIKDIMDLQKINETIKENGKEATEGLNKKGQKLSKKTLGEMWDKTKNFAKTTPGKITMGLAALGLVSNLLSSGDNQSPLSPEMNHKESTGPINNDSNVASKAPSSNTGRKTIYTDSSSGLQFKMSAKSKNKVNQMQMARQLSAQTGGDTNVNVYDDRSQISSNWLERKFSELV